MTDPSSILSFLSAALGFVAAFLWWKSTLVRVLPDPNDSGWVMIDDNDGTDTFRTIERRLVWNRWAAMVTGFAVCFHAISLLLAEVQP